MPTLYSACGIDPCDLEPAMAFAHRHEPSQGASINITPLVDVLLVLLVIFMVAAPIASRTLPLEFPGRSEPKAAPAEALRLRIGMAGDYALDGQPVDRRELPSALRQATAGLADARLSISSADDSDYQAFVTALAAARSAGIENIATEVR